MNILVPGGAGYIGSHTVYELIERGHRVVILDNLNTGFEKLIHPKAIFYKGDLRNEELLSNIINKEEIEGVIHFAANSLVGESMIKPLLYYDNNVGGMISLLKCMKENNVKYIVFSSSAATYGIPEKIPIKETDKTNPINPYGQTKLMMEQIMSWADKAYNIKFIALRYFNACGAHKNGKIGELHNPETHLIPLVLQVPLGKREQINVYGNDYNTKDGTCIRDYIHVCDLADAHIKALDYLKNENKSEIINLGNNIGYSVLEIINAAKEVTNKDIKTVITERRPGDPDVLIANNKKAKELLNWEPKNTDIKEIINSAWNFYIKNYTED